MKYFLSAVAATLLATPVFGQQIEFSGRANASFSNFRGENAAQHSVVNYNTSGAAGSSTINPFGKTLGAGFGASVRAQRVAKTNFLSAFDLGYDWMQARTDIPQVNYISSVASRSYTTSGTTHLYTQCLTAFAGAGWRLSGNKLQLDALVGPELAYVLTAHERSDGTTTSGSWSTDTKRSTANSLDFRLRGDVTIWRSRVGLAFSYAYGFTNYAPATTLAPDPAAYAGIVRLGLAYRLK